MNDDELIYLPPVRRDGIEKHWWNYLDCPMGGAHVFEEVSKEINGDEIRRLEECTKCGFGVWHVKTKK